MEFHPRFSRAAVLFLGFFALYASTAQRGLGWGDSGEFQYRILTLGAEGILKGCDSFATAHPLYVVLGKLICSTSYQVTLVSAFFGALAVSLFYWLAHDFFLAVLFALAHGLWWLSTVSEVYTMSLAFFAAELLAFRRFRETGSSVALVALAALNGLHLEIHNLALLSIPVYACVVFRGRGASTARARVAAALVWLACASFWIWSFFALGPREVLFGSYAAQVLTLKPILPMAVPFNFALGALTLAVPALLVAWNWRAKGEKRETRDASGGRETRDWALIALFAIHFLFWSTYFIVSQYTFILPSALLAYLLASSAVRGRISPKCAVLLILLQLSLPALVWAALAKIEFPPAYRALHPGRNDAAYFALPWHMTDDSASRAAVLQRTPWDGYP